MAHVWVLNTFQRDDAYCEHDSNVVAVYSKNKFNEARKDFKKLCDEEIKLYKNEYEDKDTKSEIYRSKDENGYHFSIEICGYDGLQMNYVGLKKMELM